MRPERVGIKSGADGRLAPLSGLDNFDFDHMLGKLPEDIRRSRRLILSGERFGFEVCTCITNSHTANNLGNFMLKSQLMRMGGNTATAAGAELPRQIFVTPRACKDFIASSSQPSSRSNAQLCSPTSGGGADCSLVIFS